MITLFGVIWIGILFFCMLCNSLTGMCFLTVLSSTLQSANVFVIGDNGVGSQVITSMVFIAWMLLQRENSKIKLRYRSIGIQIGFLLILAIILYSSIANGVIWLHISRIIQLLIYILCYFMMYQAGEKISIDYTYQMIRKITIFLLVVGVIQLLITTGYLPRLSIIQILLYNDTDPAVYYHRDGYFRILSTYMEPSYYAGYLVGAFYYFLSCKKERKKNYILLFMIFFEIIMTFSSTAYASFALIGILYFANTKEGKMKLFILLGGVIGFLVMYYGFYDVLDQVIFSKSESGSGVARHYINLAAKRKFESSPVYGVGYKESRASSVFYTLLSELGIIGLITYIYTNIAIIFPLFSKKLQSIFDERYLGVCIAVSSVIVCQIVAVPDLDICTYWMWMNILALSYKKITVGREQIEKT